MIRASFLIRHHSFLGMVFLCMLLAGCGRGERFKDLHEYVEKLKHSPALFDKQIDINQEIKIPSVTTYRATSMREPFTGMLSVVAGNMANPLEAYSLNMLRLIGTVTQADITSGYVLTPDNMMYEVKIGDVIGDHYGKIISISPNELKILEQQSEEGKATSNVVTLQLKDDH